MDKTRIIYQLTVYTTDDGETIDITQKNDFKSNGEKLSTIKFLKYDLDDLLSLDPEEIPRNDSE